MNLKTLTISEFLEVTQEKLKLANELNCLVGFWIDNNILYIDLSKEFEDLNDCLNFARENNQLAIWDGINNKSIALN